MMANRRVVERLLVAIPPAVMLCAIFALASPDPFHDEWLYVYELAELREGRDLAEVLWAQNDVHRLVIPRALALPILTATGYDSRALMVLTWVFGILVLWALISAGRLGSKHPTMTAPIVLSSVLVFSFIHVNTWFAGFQHHFLITQALVCWGVVAYCRPSASDWRRLALASLCFVGASFSALHGAVGWIIGLLLTPFVIGAGRRLLSATALLILGLGCAYLYSLGFAYEISPYGFGPEEALRRPLELIWFVMVVLGGPLTPGVTEDPVAAGGILGGCLSLAFLATTLVVLRRRRTDLAPLIGLGLFSIGFAFSAAFGRLWVGYEFALRTRYMVESVVLISSLLFLWWALYYEDARSRPKLLAAFGALTLVVWLNDLGGYRRTRSELAERGAVTTILPFADLLDDRLGMTEQHPFFRLRPWDKHMKLIRAGYQDLVELGYREPKQVSFIREPDPSIGTIEYIRPRFGGVGERSIVTLGGRATLPDRQPPPAVVISVNDEEKFFTVAGVGADSRWEATFPGRGLLPGENQIQAWAYDPANQQLRMLEKRVETVLTRAEP